MPIITSLVNIVLKILTSAVKPEKKMKNIQMGKEEIKLCLLVKWSPMFKFPKNIPKNLLELKSELSKAAECQVNIPKSIIFIYYIAMSMWPQN